MGSVRRQRTMVAALCVLLLLPTAAAATDTDDGAELTDDGVVDDVPASAELAEQALVEQALAEQVLAEQVQVLAETGPPTHLGASSTLGRVHLWWSYPDPPPEREVTGWVVARREPAGAWSDLATVEIEEYEDAAVVPGRRYEYRVRATGPDGDGAVSSPVAVTAVRRDLAGSRSARLVTTASVASSEGVRERWVANETRPATSPDGRWTAVSCMENTERVHLCRVPTVGPGASQQLTSMLGLVETPAWSPDGTSIAFALRVGATPASVWVVPAAGGTPTRVLDRAEEPEWDRDGTLIVTDLSTSTPRLARVTASGGRRAIAGTSGGRAAAVSPDGRYLAFTLPGTTSGPSGDADRDRVLALLPLAGAATTPSVVALADGGYGRATWRPDGRAVAARFAKRTRTNGMARDTYGLAAFRLVTSGGARLEATEHVTSPLGHPAYRALGVHLTAPPTLTGPAPRLGFAVDTQPAGTTFTCRLDGGTAAACSSPWRGSGLATGAHHLVVEALEPSGERTVTSHRWQVDATPPVVTVTATPAVTLASRATVSYRATDGTGVRNYDVRYRRARFDGGFGAWVRPDAWQATTATSRSLSLSRGYEYCVSVRARDTLGNVSAWSPQRCTSRPLDDRSLTASTGWTRGTGSVYLEGTVTSSSRTGAELTRGTVAGTRIYVVATRCPTCGTADVFIGSTRVGRLDLHATTTRHQQVLALPASSSVRTGKLTIRVTSRSAPVRIDGVAVRRT